MKKNLRNDLFIISSLINKNEKILDIGCGNGNLLDYLTKEKDAECRGIEIKQSGINECLKKGLSVIQGDANYDLDDYPDNCFSTVILSQTIQAMDFPERVIKNMVRIGKRAIISFPNFGFWKVRRDFLFNGLMPKNDIIPYEWFNTPNIHLCSFFDFKIFCERKKIKIDDFLCLNENGLKIKRIFFPNLFSYQVVFSVSKIR
ncbi:MAG: methionine biosynthesis protein MetW [Pseudomonadota bacterium]|nr:methionine biosynthesis protein MetW [Pseudomonadota bacterium]